MGKHLNGKIHITRVCFKSNVGEWHLSSFYNNIYTFVNTYGTELQYAITNPVTFIETTGDNVLVHYVALPAHSVTINLNLCKYIICLQEKSQ